MPRGRKPVPTTLRVLRGNPSKTPMPQNEPAPQTLSAPPPPPAHLDATAAQHWRDNVAGLVACGLLTEADLDTYAAYCETYSVMVQASREVQDLGITLVDPETGKRQRNPALITLENAKRDLRSLGSEIGLTPASRSRIERAVTDKPADPAAEFL